ncbi:MAG: DUF1223 domain-containing protein [Gammaproteobacteria bacterium]|nr:DUF1223 domain-containing protein [Gammaproteobacteria bacterium]
MYDLLALLRQLKQFLFTITAFALVFVISPSADAKPLTFSNGQQTTTFIELFTSEGCSSCPPADRWMRQFTNHPELWKAVIPIAFHVDYWNNLGWQDRFSSNAFSERQRRYRKHGNITSIYTPGFVVDGTEWVGWFKRQGIRTASNKRGLLTVTVEHQQATVHYHAEQPQPLASPLEFNLAILGFGIQTDVHAGENRGRQLTHDFVVLGHSQTILAKTLSWHTPLPDYLDTEVHRYALVAWVTDPNTHRPRQAAGHWWQP